VKETKKTRNRVRSLRLYRTPRFGWRAPPGVK
jgi:hypothetical protein